MNKIISYLMALIVIFSGVFTFCAIVSLPFWLMWNWLIPVIFGLPEITWLQAFGLWTFLVLVRSSNFNYSKTFTKSNTDTDGSEKSPFSDLSWDGWLDEIQKKYRA